MKVKVKFLGFPDLKRKLGGDEIDLRLHGPTLSDLLDSLRERCGQEVAQVLLDEEGKVDQTIQIIRNGKEWLSRDELDQPLRDGDSITFLLMMAGG
jgi:molybdopterin converting factor small subunit